MTDAVFNPHGKPVEELPVIYGFASGSSPMGVIGELVAADGTPMGSHFSSSEGWLLYDLGILEETRPDRHDGFKQHYPDGYRMEFVSNRDIKKTPGLMEAFRLNKELAKKGE